MKFTEDKIDDMKSSLHLTSALKGGEVIDYIESIEVENERLREALKAAKSNFDLSGESYRESPGGKEC